jgi:transposase
LILNTKTTDIVKTLNSPNHTVRNTKVIPRSVQVFEGNTGDPKTLAPQIRKLRERFGLRRITLVGDRGMLTEARLREDIRPEDGLDWITAHTSIISTTDNNKAPRRKSRRHAVVSERCDDMASCHEINLVLVSEPCAPKNLG